MKQVKKLSGVTLATAAATMLLAGVSSTAIADSDHKTAEVKCSGINSCKGTSACATATSGCAGQNSCKGKGWIKVSAKDCAAKGGTEVQAKDM